MKVGHLSLRTILQNFINHVESLEGLDGKNTERYEKEFQELKKLTESLKNDPLYTCLEGERECNRKKNRYKDILPYDRTRVVLSSFPGVPGSDFVNGNYIRGASGSRAYIASQGPLAHTLNDFWRLVVECEVQVIIMASNETEGGKHKCECYWVEEDGDEKQYGNVSVSYIKSRQVCPDFLVRTLKIKYPNNSGEIEERTICQFHYRLWPDHGVPVTVCPLLDMVRLVRDCQASETLPVLVHCSAGCGRTGTICAIDYVWGLLRTGKLHNNLDLFALVQEMRKQRVAIVQTLEQYVLLHRAVKELFKERLKLIDSHPYENITQEGTPVVEKEKEDKEDPEYEELFVCHEKGDQSAKPLCIPPATSSPSALSTPTGSLGRKPRGDLVGQNCGVDRVGRNASKHIEPLRRSSSASSISMPTTSATTKGQVSLSQPPPVPQKTIKATQVNLESTPPPLARPQKLRDTQPPSGFRPHRHKKCSGGILVSKMEKDAENIAQKLEARRLHKERMRSSSSESGLNSRTSINAEQKSRTPSPAATSRPTSSAKESNDLKQDPLLLQLEASEQEKSLQCEINPYFRDFIEEQKRLFHEFERRKQEQVNKKRERQLSDIKESSLFEDKMSAGLPGNNDSRLESTSSGTLERVARLSPSGQRLRRSASSVTSRSHLSIHSSGDASASLKSLRKGTMGSDEVLWKPGLSNDELKICPPPPPLRANCGSGDRLPSRCDRFSGSNKFSSLSKRQSSSPQISFSCPISSSEEKLANARVSPPSFSRIRPRPSGKEHKDSRICEVSDITSMTQSCHPELNRQIDILNRGFDMKATTEESQIEGEHDVKKENRPYIATENFEDRPALPIKKSKSFRWFRQESSFPTPFARSPDLSRKRTNYFSLERNKDNSVGTGSSPTEKTSIDLPQRKDGFKLSVYQSLQEVKDLNRVVAPKQDDEVAQHISSGKSQEDQSVIKSVLTMNKNLQSQNSGGCKPQIPPKKSIGERYRNPLIRGRSAGSKKFDKETSLSSVGISTDSFDNRSGGLDFSQVTGRLSVKDECHAEGSNSGCQFDITRRLPTPNANEDIVGRSPHKESNTKPNSPQSEGDESQVGAALQLHEDSKDYVNARVIGSVGGVQSSKYVYIPIPSKRNLKDKSKLHEYANCNLAKGRPIFTGASKELRYKTASEETNLSSSVGLSEDWDKKLSSAELSTHSDQNVIKVSGDESPQSTPMCDEVDSIKGNDFRECVKTESLAGSENMFSSDRDVVDFGETGNSTIDEVFETVNYELLGSTVKRKSNKSHKDYYLTRELDSIAKRVYEDCEEYLLHGDNRSPVPSLMPRESLARGFQSACSGSTLDSVTDTKQLIRNQSLLPSDGANLEVVMNKVSVPPQGLRNRERRNSYRQAINPSSNYARLLNKGSTDPKRKVQVHKYEKIWFEDSGDDIANMKIEGLLTDLSEEELSSKHSDSNSSLFSRSAQSSKSMETLDIPYSPSSRSSEGLEYLSAGPLSQSEDAEPIYANSPTLLVRPTTPETGSAYIGCNYGTMATTCHPYTKGYRRDHKIDKEKKFPGGVATLPARVSNGNGAASSSRNAESQKSLERLQLVQDSNTAESKNRYYGQRTQQTNRSQSTKQAMSHEQLHYSYFTSPKEQLRGLDVRLLPGHRASPKVKSPSEIKQQSGTSASQSKFNSTGKTPSSYPPAPPKPPRANVTTKNQLEKSTQRPPTISPYMTPPPPKPFLGQNVSGHLSAIGSQNVDIDRRSISNSSSDRISQNGGSGSSSSIQNKVAVPSGSDNNKINCDAFNSSSHIYRNVAPLVSMHANLSPTASGPSCLGSSSSLTSASSIPTVQSPSRNSNVTSKSQDGQENKNKCVDRTKLPHVYSKTQGFASTIADNRAQQISPFSDVSSYPLSSIVRVSQTEGCGRRSASSASERGVASDASATEDTTDDENEGIFNRIASPNFFKKLRKAQTSINFGFSPQSNFYVDTSGKNEDRVVGSRAAEDQRYKNTPLSKSEKSKLALANIPDVIYGDLDANNRPIDDASVKHKYKNVPLSPKPIVKALGKLKSGSKNFTANFRSYLYNRSRDTEDGGVDDHKSSSQPLPYGLMRSSSSGAALNLVVGAQESNQQLSVPKPGPVTNLSAESSSSNVAKSRQQFL